MRVDVSVVIDRPVRDVFRFVAHDHVRNHPRWDPDMQLEQVSKGPVAAGTIIRRRHTHRGTPVEGTMEVVEYEPDRAFGAVIREGATEIRGRMTFAAESRHRTVLTISVDVPVMDESTDATPLRSLMERSAVNIKHLVESDR